MNPEDRVSARLDEIEAGIIDLRPFVFGVHKAGELTSDQPATRRYRNRLLHALLLLYHLEADVNRLARRRKKAKRVVSEFVEGSNCVRVCWRAANTHKHGIGGHSGNATLPNAVITVVKDANKAPSPAEADAIVVGMLISDADEGSFASQPLLECAVREWVAFLRNEFGLDHSAWLAKCFPTPSAPSIELRPGGENVVPKDSVVTFEVPPHVRDAMVGEMKKRREES